MIHNFITPSATQILCDSININPFVGGMAGKSFPGPSFCDATMGDAVFFYWGASGQNPAPLNQLIVLRVKSNGQFCWYISGSPATAVLKTNYTNAIRIGERSFVLGINAFGYNIAAVVTIPEIFIPSGIVQFTPTLITFPVAPCGAATSVSKTFYSGNGRVITEYIEPFALAYNLWVATLTINGSGVSTINAGACGNFPNAVDPIVTQTTDILNFPLNQGYGNGTYSFDQFGNQIYKNIEFNALSGNFIGVYKTIIKDGALNCAGTGSFPSYALSESYVYNQLNNVFKGFECYLAPSSMLAGGTDLPCSVTAHQFASMQLFNGPYFVELLTPGGGNSWGGVYLKDSNVWIGARQNVTVSINTPRQALPVGITAPPPVVNAPLAFSLLNWHRPISTRGLFKT